MKNRDILYPKQWLRILRSCGVFIIMMGPSQELQKGKKVYFNVKEEGGWERYEPSAKELDPEGGSDLDFDIIDDRRVYYRCVDRTYNIYELPDKILKELTEEHDEFIEMVKGLNANEETSREYYKKHEKDKCPNINSFKLLGHT